MVYILTKKINQKEYLYLVDSIRKQEKVIQKTIKYIGPKRLIREEELECMRRSYQNQDWILTEYVDQLSYRHHADMKHASTQWKHYLHTLDPVSKQKERERFLSQFIAHSNAIEGSTLTIKDTFNYLFQDISPPGKNKKELSMASNMLHAWQYLEKNHTQLPTKTHLQRLHALVNKDIEADKTIGTYKKVQNYIGDIYTSSFLFVPEKMNQLLKWIKKAQTELNDFEIAFQSHAQFEIIHPFVDGNGRVGRLLLNWLLLHKKLMPLAIPVHKRHEYITALENTRRGKKEAICLFCYNEYIHQYKDATN